MACSALVCAAVAHDRGTQFGVGREHPVKADQMQAWTRHQRGESLHEFQRRHNDVRGAITISRLQLEHHLPGRIEREPFFGNGRAASPTASAPALTSATPLARRTETARGRKIEQTADRMAASGNGQAFQ